MKKDCIACNKNHPMWMYQYEGKEHDICMMCNSDNIKPVEIVKHEAEEVEDKGCAGGACTL